MMDFFTLKIRKDKVNYTIKEAALAGFFVAFSTMMIAFFTPSGFNALYIADISMYVLLSFGVLFNNRLSAVLITIYFSAAKIFLFIMLSVSGMIIGAILQILIGLLFAVIFLRGTKAVFLYHKHLGSRGAE